MALVLGALFFFLALSSQSQGQEPFRPPSVPLIVSDPYLSVWLGADHAYDTWPTHWAGGVTAFLVMVRVDNTSYRLLGLDSFSSLCGGNGTTNDSALNMVGPAEQLSVEVMPLTTLYRFRAGGVAVNMSFTTTSLPDDLEVFSRGTTYITFSAGSVDGMPHKVQIYYENTADIIVNDYNTTVYWSRQDTPDEKAVTMRMGPADQNVLGERGDRTRISWGFFYVAIPKEEYLQTSMTAFYRAACAFTAGKSLPEDDIEMRPCDKDWPVLSAVWDLGTVEAKRVFRHMVVFLDDIFSFNYFGVNLPPMWRQTYNYDPLLLARQALNDYGKLMGAIDRHDTQLMANITAVAGWRYAAVTALAYRQVFGAMKIAWHPKRNETWGFQKEISTAGAINTVDVLYPASPQLFYTNPELLRICFLPLLVYCNNETDTKYNLTWPTHSLGTWPIADMEPEAQEQLPLEVAADMLLMLAVVAQRQEDGVAYLKPYQKLIQTWAEFVESQLPLPPKQKCTDDFEGAEPNNTNLALKAIISLEAYAILQDMMNQSQVASRYRGQWQTFRSFWMVNAQSGAGQRLHYRREFELENSFSLKYNIIYQEFLNVTVFPKEMLTTELYFYAEDESNPFGVPMDDRHPFTLAEYQGLLVALAPAKSVWRQQFANQLFRFANCTQPRFPLSDYYFTANGTNPSSNFIARPTMGDLFAVVILG